MYAEDFWLFASMLFKKKEKAKADFFCITTAQIRYYMIHPKTGNPRNLRLYAESKGNMLQVAGSGWSSPVYGTETAQMRRGCRTELCLETQLLLSLGKGGRERHSAACFTLLLHRMRRPVLPMWSVWTLLSSCPPAGMCVLLG